jgi:tRNA(Arg) A34 adenosine deaminase TadA
MPGPEPAVAWDRALELAWEAFRGGTTPVGVVVIDAAGGIVAEGRNRLIVAEGASGCAVAFVRSDGLAP